MNEEVQRQMDFIVAQQAQFSVDIQQLKETQAVEAKLWREKYNALTDAITSVVGMVGKLAKAQDRTDKQLSELTNKQAETDDRLNALIHVVESQLSGNGQPKRSRSKRPPNQTKPRRKR